MEKIVQMKRRRYSARRWLPSKLLFLVALFGVLAIFKFLNSLFSQSTDFPLSTITEQSPKIASQTVIKGQASVTDGDSLEIHGTRIRLFGIDAPESRQTCTNSVGKEYRCGQQAANALDNKIKAHTVECRQKDVDQYDRVVAVCLVGGEDINGWMVAQGWALAYRQYSTDYVSQEAGASNSKLGIWQGKFEPPWVWRRNNPERRPTFGNNSSNSQRPTKPRQAVYYRPGDTLGNRFPTLEECNQARERNGNIGVCVMK